MNVMEACDIFIGTDIVEVSRIDSSIITGGKRFLNRIYTDIEQKYCDSKSNPSIHYAGRFAAKEAVMKALKSAGHNKPIPFTSIDVHSKNNGEPVVILNSDFKGICRVSISHTGAYAIASAIFISE